MIEPVFAHARHNRQVTRFLRRGRAAVRVGWRLLRQRTTSPSLVRHHNRLHPAPKYDFSGAVRDRPHRMYWSAAAGSGSAR